jgi:antitoxin (DNA-binding transcriptional repressor) of toxin-antitoxin stability system
MVILFDHYYTPRMEMAISKFKAQCLKLVDNLDDEGIILLKHNKPVARVLPIKLSREERNKLIGSMKGKIKIHGDIFSTGIKWNAES